MSLEGLQLGQYRLVRLLGTGGMGEVYLATDPRVQQQVAIKVSKDEPSAYPTRDSARDAIRLFQREARAIAQLDHPHILPLFAYGEEIVQGITFIYIVMPFRPEGSFAQWLQQRPGAGLLPLADIAYFIGQAADALQYAHDQQILHQDVKPSNFLIRLNRNNPNRPDLLLADFGIAKLNSATASVSGSIRGTPIYMAPEQWEGQPVPASDQYALAVMTYELLTGSVLYSGRPEYVMYQHLQGQPLPPSRHNPSLSNSLDAVILKALAKKPSDRFPSIAAFAVSLQQALQGNDSATLAKPVAISDASTFIKPPMDDDLTSPMKPSERGEDLQATLAISKVEALSGTHRTLTLPGGRRITVSIPAGMKDGHVMRMEGLGNSSPIGGMPGALLLTLSIQENGGHAPYEERSMVGLTLPASNPGIHGAVAPVTPVPGPPAKKKGITLRITILIGLAVLMIAASTGFFYLRNIGPVLGTAVNTANNSNAIATTHAQDSTAFAATSTAVAQSQKTVVVSQATATPGITSTPTPTPSTPQANTPTTTANGNPYPPYTGTLVLNDPLSDNSGGHDWQLIGDQYGACAFANGAYQINYSHVGSYLFCTGLNTRFSNFAFQVQMTIVQGDTGGVVFRVNDASTTFYYFHINRQGAYSLDLYVDNTRKNATTLISGTAPSFSTGLNQANLIAVITRGNTFDIYINHVHIASTTDPSNAYSTGQIGFSADAVDTPTAVLFSNAEVWTF